ncbi:MAG: hypothetical protein ABUK01_10585 [Leptospirales bacterium]
MLQKNRYIFFILLLFFFHASTIPETSYILVKHSELDEIEQILQNDSSLAILRLEKILVEFYRTAEANGTTEVFPSLDNVPPGTMEKPIQRKDQLLRSLITVKQSPFYIKDASNIYRAHVMLARAYALNKEYLKAADHSLNALRFRSLKLTPEVWADETRMELAGDSPEVRSQAKDFLKTKQEYNIAIKEFNDLISEKHLEEDRLAREGASQVEVSSLSLTYKVKIEAKQQEVALLQSAFEKQLENFKTYAQKYNKESADFLVETGKIFKAIDNQIRDKNKIANYRQQYSSSYNYTSQQSWRTLDKHISYINLLSLATKLDPLNAKTPYHLGVQYGKNGNTNRAINSLLLALEYNKNSPEKLSFEEIYEIYSLLGGYYHRINKYVEAVFYYEKAIAADPSPDYYMRLNTARIHVQNTGNYLRAKQLLNEIEKELPGLKLDELNNMKSQYEIQSLYIIIYERTWDTENLIKTLEKATEIHRNLEKEITQSRNAMQAKYTQLLGLKKQMGKTRVRKDIQNYYTALDEYRTLQKRASELSIVRNRMNLKKIYFTLAREKEKERKINEAMEAYRIAESFGISAHQARREIQRLNDTYINYR